MFSWLKILISRVFWLLLPPCSKFRGNNYEIQCFFIVLLGKVSRLLFQQIMSPTAPESSDWVLPLFVYTPVTTLLEILQSRIWALVEFWNTFQTKGETYTLNHLYYTKLELFAKNRPLSNLSYLPFSCIFSKSVFTSWIGTNGTLNSSTTKKIRKLWLIIGILYFKKSLNTTWITVQFVPKNSWIESQTPNKDKLFRRHSQKIKNMLADLNGSMTDDRFTGWLTVERMRNE